MRASGLSSLGEGGILQYKPHGLKMEEGVSGWEVIVTFPIGLDLGDWVW